MPIYEFVCKDCDHFFEALVPRPGAKEPCPECGSRRVAQAMSRPAALSASRDGEVCDPPSCERGP